ncbi:MAG TPA: ABC transporter permease [Rectinemataceae bacterium]|nr:ABC transporter permease [Rectinemataceae bacterium]
MNLYSFIVRRLLFMILVLAGVSILVFSIMMILPPGQRLAAYVTSERVTPEQMDAMIAKYHLNDPAPLQYVRWVGNILRGQFGFSVTAKEPVIKAFSEYFPITLELVLYSTPMIILVGIWLGTLGAVRKDTPIDHATRVFAIVGYSLPTFWLGLLLIMFFYGFLGIFPPGVLSNSMRTVVTSSGFHRYTHLITIDAILNWRWDVFLDGLYHMFLPALNLVIINSAMIMRLMRSSMLESLGQDYMMTARAKGADAKTLYRHHARRNALLPVITVSGLTFAGLMGGMVITETIFNRTGIGWWMAEAATQLDVPAIMFNVLFLGVIYVVINLIVDIIYAYVDPRVRLG